MSCLAGLTARPVLAQTQTEEERVQLIMSTPRGAVPFRNSLCCGRYHTIKRLAGKATSRALVLTKAEMWSVAKSNVEAVKKAAGRYGVVVHQVGASPTGLLGPAAADMPMDDKRRLILEQAKASLAVVGIKMSVMPPAGIVEYALTGDAGRPAGASDHPKMTVALNESTVVGITGSRADVRSDMIVLRGTVDGTGAPAVLMWWPDGKMVGTIQHQGRLYSFRHMGGQVQAVVEMIEDRMPREHGPMPQRVRANDPSLRDDPLVTQGEASLLRPRTAARQAVAEAASKALGGKTAQKGKAQPTDVTIDVIVAYTKKAASNYSDVKRELVDLSIEEANESFRQSGIGQVKLRLVHAYQTDYVEEGVHFDHVWRFADKGDGYMDEIHALRDQFKADVGILIVDDPNGCGLATRVFADADEAFAVVHHDCAALTYSVAHEIGHLIGARHEPAIDKMTTPFPYGHGFVNGTKWRDIMSYRESCGGCPRLPVWSSPVLKVRGETAGTPEQDNARVISEQAARVAAFR
jgi:hypothetical protein